MGKYTEEFQYKVVETALKHGIMPTAREFKISRNTLKRWLRIYKKHGREFFIKYYHFHKRVPCELEKIIVNLKEKKPSITLTEIQRTIKEKQKKTLSLNGIHVVLERYGMAGKGSLPLIGENTPEIQKGMKLAHIFLEQREIEKAANTLNYLPALLEFSILKNIPSHLLSLRRRAEQLRALWGSLSMAEMYKKAKELRRECEKERLFFTATFVATLEMNALNFLGYPAKVSSLYKRYFQYLPGLTQSLKYIFLMECFISFIEVPGKYPEGIFKTFPYNLERFVSRQPKKDYSILWYDAVRACFESVWEIDKSSRWMEKLIEEVPVETKKEYLTKYLHLLAIKGEYTKILEFNESFEDISMPFFIKFSLARARALLGTGKPKEAIEIALNAFYKTEKEHLLPSMAGFTFFLSSCYAALQEEKKAVEYLKMARHFSKNARMQKILFSLLLGFTSSDFFFRDAQIFLVKLYLSTCKTLRRTDYLKAYRFAEKKGLVGFLHRIILLHPAAVIYLLQKDKETYLPKEFLKLPVFKEGIPIFKLFLLRDKEILFYGDRRIFISSRSKDFHLLVYLFLNRKKTLNRESLINIFYKNISNPSQYLIKALSRIRMILTIPKSTLTLRKTGVYFDIEIKVDLEEFEERYKSACVSEKVGEMRHTLEEYRTAFKLYKKSPFEKMGYYYNFAEERRMLVRNMYANLCNTLIKDAEERNEIKTVRKIKEKLEKEQLLFNH